MPKLRLMLVGVIGGILALTGCQTATPAATPAIVREVVVVTATSNLAATQTVAHRPTETAIPSRGRAINSTNIWADPLDTNPATSIPAGKEFELLALHPSGQWLQIAVYEDVYWIQTDQVEILGGQVSLAAPTRVVPSSTPTPDIVALVPPTSTVVAQQLIQLPTFTPVAGFAQVYQEVQYGARAAYPLDSTTLRIMRSLDMGWVRLNITHGKTNLPTLREQIELAHQQGLKVLITVRGNVAALQRDQATYFTRYAAFAKEVARLNPDALQIWEYPNVADYWIAGDVHGASYIGLLIAAYNAIKEVNPQIQVISAPLQPVLRQQTIDRQRLDEATFLQTLYNAGGMNYIDCVGLEHLNGTAAPNLSNGRYSDKPTLYDLLDTYKNATRNQRMICITGVGYPRAVTINGFMVNRETQYTWLVSARNMLLERNDVGMLLIENMDDTSNGFTTVYRLIESADECYFCQSYDYNRYISSLPGGKTLLPLNLRAGPSIDFNPPIGMIQAEKFIVVLAVSPDEQWYRIQERENANVQGWVRAQDILLSAPLSGDVPVEVGSPTPIATITAIPRPSETPTLTPTPIVTATPRPSLTPSPTKTPSSSTPRP